MQQNKLSYQLQLMVVGLIYIFLISTGAATLLNIYLETKFEFIHVWILMGLIFIVNLLRSSEKETDEN